MAFGLRDDQRLVGHGIAVQEVVSRLVDHAVDPAREDTPPCAIAINLMNRLAAVAKAPSDVLKEFIDREKSGPSLSWMCQNLERADPERCATPNVVVCYCDG